MKSLILFFNLLFLFVLTPLTTNAQKIYFPDNTSNEPDMQLSFIERTDKSTDVGFIYTPSESNSMFIHSGTIIEDAFSFNSRKYRIKEFHVNEQKQYLNHAYSVKEGEQYLVTLKFEPLSQDIEIINIHEPQMPSKDYSPWSWNNIHLDDNKLRVIVSSLVEGNEEEKDRAALLLSMMLEVYPNNKDLNIIASLIDID